jgi:hypothetical protein
VQELVGGRYLAGIPGECGVQDYWAELIEAPAATPKPKTTATSYAVCPDCKTLHIGIQADSILCRHEDANGQRTQRIIKAEVASRVTDTGWRFDLNQADGAPLSPAGKLALVEALLAGDPEQGIPPLIDQATARRLLGCDPYWSAPYPKKGMTETTMKPANEGDE